MKRTRPLTLSVDVDLLAAYARAHAATPLPLPVIVLDAALRAQLAAAGYAVPAPLLAPPGEGSDRRTRVGKDPPSVVCSACAGRGVPDGLPRRSKCRECKGIGFVQKKDAAPA